VRKIFFEPVLFPKLLIEEEGLIQIPVLCSIGVRSLFHYNDKGEEATTHINRPPGFINPINFINQTKSNEN
jgi:hypothetical protein